MRRAKAYDGSVRIQPYLGTLLGTGIGMIAVLLWLLTFEPHGGPEYSRYLFPAAQPLLAAAYGQEAPPVPVFFFAALGHWLLPGVAVDLVRALVGRKSPPSPPPPC